MRWTKDDMLAYMAKRERFVQGADVPDEGRESKLQGRIMDHCRREGWPCQCFRQSKKAKGFLVPGLPD